MTFAEDASRIRTGAAPRGMETLRTITMALCAKPTAGPARSAVGSAALGLGGLHGMREEQAGADGADLQAADLAALWPVSLVRS
ncbi:hypothetical protein [Streptomyces sp. Root369]|uniref:hypothetical protein n=1 Tax=Streptomyces sp. Root369 TaxID=1736523 RepID=UPI0018FF04A3|nr:hypothetical protein [Streptomyces sp. Root369]